MASLLMPLFSSNKIYGITFDATVKQKKVLSMSVNVPHSKPPPKPARNVSPAEWVWLDRIKRQLAYDEYMQIKREFWLAERPFNKESRQNQRKENMCDE